MCLLCIYTYAHIHRFIYIAKKFAIDYFLYFIFVADFYVRVFESGLRSVSRKNMLAKAKPGLPEGGIEGSKRI